jgi:tetratricopeptide (TPR) repeat protein
MAPDAELGWHFRGSLLSRLRRHDEALLAWRRAAELAPEVGAIQLCFAQAQRRIGDYEGALATLRSISGKPMTREAGRRIATQMLALRLLRPLGRARRALRAMTD